MILYTLYIRIEYKGYQNILMEMLQAMDEHKLNRFAVIGNPVSHSQSPSIHQAFAEQYGIKLSYEKLLSEPEDFQQSVLQFFAEGGQGLNITTPFKADAAALADRCSVMAELSESVNTLYLDKDSGELVGESTDGAGWFEDAKRLSINLSGARVLVIGAGGAARVVINQLLLESVQLIHVCNRTLSKAEKLIDSGVTASNLEEIPSNSWDLIINTLSVGWQGNYPTLNVEVCASTKAYDLNYGQGAEAFQKWFLEAGGLSANSYEGWGMLVEQAALSFSIWLNKKPDTTALIEKGPA
ncbi:MAG: shikimate dehydrogenase [Enterobacterales bacterium]|jgi:shikimate dehydrogenase